jgi:hypothetical protein
MLTRLLFVLALLPAQVHAQAWGPDGAQPVVYPTVTVLGDLSAMKAGNSPLLVGDGSNAWGGTPPATSIEPTDISNPVVYTDGLGGTPSVGGTERKARFLCNSSHVGKHDAIRGFGQATFGHNHTFAGNAGTNGSSTFTTLRNENTQPTCPGGKLNNSAYWAVSVEKPNALGDGITRIKKPDDIVLYYVSITDATFGPKFVGIPRGLAVITGMDLDDPDLNKPGGRLAEVTAANAVNIYGSYQNVGVGAKWFCDSSGINASYLTTSAGVDALGNCPSTSKISARVSGQHCWDGHNLTSPSGRGHVRPYMREYNYSTEAIGPLGWYYIPSIEIRWEFSHQGAADYTTWTCPSDATAAAAAGRAMGHCESFHVDAIFAWDQRAFDEFEKYCIGIEGDPWDNTCDDSTISATNRLKTTGISNANRFYGTVASDYFDLPATSVSPMWGRAKLKKGF